MSLRQRALKRGFDLAVAGFGLLLCWWLIALAVVVARLDTGVSGLFRHERVGRNGRVFTIYKVRTMRPGQGSSVTRAGDARISPSGRLLRKLKIDELPQLINVLRGDMSLVGPRPDVPGFADKLRGEERELLSVRPGITGPATLKYRNEEELLASACDPDSYNANVLWPDKVRINLAYLRNWSLKEDFLCLIETVYPRLGRYAPRAQTYPSDVVSESE